MRYKYANISWEIGSTPPRLLVGGGKGERIQEMGMRSEGEVGFEVIRVLRVDTVRLPEPMTENELQDWIDEEPRRLKVRLDLCKEEVEEDYIDDDGKAQLSI